MIFDKLPRPLKVVSVAGRSASIPRSENKLIHNGTSVTLQKVILESAGVVQIKHSLQARKTSPDAFLIGNTPEPEVEPDQSYEYIPDVEGGVAPYTFHLDGTLQEGFEFDPTTGELSRPPQ